MFIDHARGKRSNFRNSRYTAQPCKQSDAISAARVMYICSPKLVLDKAVQPSNQRFRMRQRFGISSLSVGMVDEAQSPMSAGCLCGVPCKTLESAFPLRESMMANAGPASVPALVSLWTFREEMRSLESCFTSPSGNTWHCQLRIGDGCIDYHAIDTGRRFRGRSTGQPLTFSAFWESLILQDGDGCALSRAVRLSMKWNECRQGASPTLYQWGRPKRRSTSTG